MADVDVPTNTDAIVEDPKGLPLPEPTYDRKALIDELRTIGAKAAKDEADAANTDESVAPTTPAPAVASPSAPSVDAEVQRRLAEREAYRETFEKAKADARVEADKILASAREEAQSILDELRRNPAAAAKKAGWTDGGELIRNLAEDGTPMAEMRRQILEGNAKLAKLEALAQGFTQREKDALVAHQKATEDAKASSARAEWEAVEQRFIKNAIDPEKRPGLAGALRLQGLQRAFVQEAHSWAVEANKTRSSPLTEDEIADHFEALYNPSAAQKQGAAPPQAGGKAARAVTQAQASERRSAPRPVDEMERGSSDWRKAVAKEAREAAEAAEKAAAAT